MRAIASAALLSLGVLAACATESPDIVAAPADSGLASASYANVAPVAGVRHVALDARGNQLVEDAVRAALLNPGTASFATPFAGAETGTIVRVCGTVSASVAGQRYDNVPFVVTIDYARITATGPANEDAASLTKLGGGIGFQGSYSDGNGNIVSFCRDEAGVTLPG